MLRDVVGEKVFQKALSQYLKEYKYSNANHHDLWDSLTKVRLHLFKQIVLCYLTVHNG